MTTPETRGHLSGKEEADAERRAAPRAVVVFEAIRHEAVEELARHNDALFWSGLAVGLSMEFSFIAEALLQSALTDTSWRPLVSKFGYSIGFMIVILGRQQLFTENTLAPMIHVVAGAPARRVGGCVAPVGRGAYSQPPGHHDIRRRPVFCRCNGVWAPVVVSSVLFALGHVYQGWVGVSQTTLTGAIFAASRMPWTTLWPAIMTHAALNTFSVLAMTDMSVPRAALLFLAG